MYNFALNTNLGKSFVIGLNLQRYRFSSNVRYTDIISNLYQDSITGFLFGYKRGNIGMGINTKFFLVTSKYFAVKNIPLALDTGALYSRDLTLKQFYSIKLNTGFSILNISNGIKYETVTASGTSESLPVVIRIGYSVILKPLQEKGEMTPYSVVQNFEYSRIINADKSYNKYADCQSLGLGLEVGTYELLYSRLGYHLQEGEKLYGKENTLYSGITYGVGLNFPIHYFIKSIPASIRYDYGNFPYDIKSIYKRMNYSMLHSLNFNYAF